MVVSASYAISAVAELLVSLALVNVQVSVLHTVLYFKEHNEIVICSGYCGSAVGCSHIDR